MNEELLQECKIEARRMRLLARKLRDEGHLTYAKQLQIIGRKLRKGKFKVRQVHILDEEKIFARKRRGYLADGGGLYLQISPSGAKSWVFRFREEGRLREMGLGPLHTTPLDVAREMAKEFRQLRLAKLDPFEERDNARQRVMGGRYRRWRGADHI